ncbi:hypothetical protein [Microvirga roseola]|uniref:hypothetical protein n=1 Tax=Microvirga roseola TaxID=2883126 RepID=UPI001E44557F|nr:hypothetical protein [Microvirga roseola]
MNSEAVSELIWHFAGHLHLTEDYTASRLTYSEVGYQVRSQVYDGEDAPEEIPQVDPVELKGIEIRVTYSPRYENHEVMGHIDAAKYQIGSSIAAGHADILTLKLPEANIDLPDREAIIVSNEFLGSPPSGDDLKPVLDPEPTTQQPDREPVYTIQYADDAMGKVAALTQQNIASDRDFFSNGGEDFDGLHHVGTGSSVSDMMDAAAEFIPDLHQQQGMGSQFWTDAVIAHDDAIGSGEITGEVLAPGRYVNGELQADNSSDDETGQQRPSVPERTEGDTDPGQVAELGANKAQNAAIIGDLNEAPATLIVLGDYYETNSIYQANILQDKDKIFDGGAFPIDLASGENRTDNIANLAIEEIVAQTYANRGIGDLNVNVDFVDGDFFDVKALSQRNYIDDGDVTIQTQYDSYSKVLTGGNGQYNAAKFVDWGKDYDVIIVLGDYHSANIISQVNLLLDNDVVGYGSGGGGYYGAAAGDGQAAYTGQNALQNEASITKHGATTFAGITGELQSLIDAIGNQDSLNANAWSSFYGAASGNLDVLFVTGNYYDFNVISQVNMIADADLGVQMNGGSGTQWLSTGGNTLINMAEIINAGGLHKQYLGGSLYEDSTLVQANLVSEESALTQSNPLALVSELVAFLDHPQGDAYEGENWTSTVFNNHDSFGNVLT